MPTEGWVSSDTNIHTSTYSGHGDATIEERATTIAGKGIELPVITEHNLNVDINPAAEKMGLRKYFTQVSISYQFAKNHQRHILCDVSAHCPLCKTKDVIPGDTLLNITEGVQ